jgi:hypothetical protein
MNRAKRNIPCDFLADQPAAEQECTGGLLFKKFGLEKAADAF